MTVGELVEHLRAQGVSVAAVGNQLQMKGHGGDLASALRVELAWRKEEALAVLGAASPSRSLPPRTHATVQHLDVGLDVGEVERVRLRFIENGTEPAGDDLLGAALVESHLTRWQRALDGVYGGNLTLYFRADGRLEAAPRGALT